jgi:hypothetical protein
MDMSPGEVFVDPNMFEIDIELLGGRWGNPVVKELKGGRSIPVYCGCRCEGGEGGGSILNGFVLVLSCRVRTGDSEFESRCPVLSGIAEVD